MDLESKWYYLLRISDIYGDSTQHISYIPADFAAGQHVPPGQSAVTAWWDRAQQQTCIVVSFNPSPK